MDFESLITSELIEPLSSTDLVDLVRRLLRAELRLHGIPLGGYHVPAQINVPDGGEDGRVEWEGPPERTNYLAGRFVILQAKAQRIGPADCRREAVSDRGCLKPAISEVLERRGSYLIVCSHPYTGQDGQSRITALREAITDAGGDPDRAKDFHFYDANVIAEWVKTHSSVALRLLETRRGLTLAPYQSLEARHNERRDFSHPYIVGDDHRAEFYSPDGSLAAFSIEEAMERLRNQLANSGQAVRVLGHSGIGKTRFVLEALKPDETDARRAMAEAVIYADYLRVEHEILRTVHKLREAGSDAILAIDECPLAVHRKLAECVGAPRSRLRLVTIDHDFRHREVRWHEIRLRPASSGVITAMLAHLAPEAEETARDRLVRFADGFPEFAIFASERWSASQSLPSAISDEDLIRRLIFQRDNPDPELERALGALGLFQVLNTEEPNERKAVAEALELLSAEALHRHLRLCEERGIVERHGRYVQLRPLPLSRHLAAAFLSRTSQECLLRVFEPEFPVQLRRRFCRTLAKLGDPRRAQQLVLTVLQRRSLAEVEAFDQNIDFLSDFAEIHPEMALNAIKEFIAVKATTDLPAISSPWNNVVWALRKLVFRHETFVEAARVVRNLAVGERESSQADNARSLFCQLYQLYLAGTEAEPRLRWALLDEGLEDPDPRVRELCLDALDRALQVSHFSRSGGEEEQGKGPPLRDWQPKTYGDIYDYHEQAIRRLLHIASTDYTLQDRAAEIFARHIRGMLRQLPIERVEPLIRELYRMMGFQSSLIRGIGDWLYFDATKAPADLVKRVQQLYEEVEPKTLPERYEYFVCSEPWEIRPPSARVDDDDQHGHLGDYALAEIRKLAEECVGDPASLDWTLRAATSRKGRSVTSFIQCLGEGVGDVRSFAQDVLARLREDAPEEVRAEVLFGTLKALAAVDAGAARELLNERRESPPFSDLLPYLLGAITIEPQDLADLAGRLDAGRVAVEKCRFLKFGGQLTHLPPEAIARLGEAMSRQSARGAWLALDLVHMYLHGKSGLPLPLWSLINKIALRDDLLNVYALDHQDIYHLDSILKRCVGAKTLTRELATGLTEKIVDFFRGDRYDLEIADELAKLLKQLALHYPEEIWAPVADAVLSNDPGFHRKLWRVVGDPWGNELTVGGPLFVLPHEMLIDWARHHPGLGPAFLVELAPIYEQVEGGINKFSSFIEQLASEFGSQPEFLSALAYKLLPSGWSGSRIPHVQAALSALETWTTHPSPKVRLWVDEQVRYLRKEIEWEQAREDERAVQYNLY